MNFKLMEIDLASKRLKVGFGLKDVKFILPKKS